MEGWLLGRTANDRNLGPRLRRIVHVLRKPAIRERLKEAGVELHFKDEEDPIADEPAFREEITALASQPAFGKFGPEAFGAESEGPRTAKDVCNAEWIKTVTRSSWTQQIQETSPKLGELLSAVLAIRRAGWPSYTAPKTDTFPHKAKAYVIVALILGACAPRCDFLPMALGIYLHNNKVPTRVIDTLAGLGICSEHQAIKAQLDETVQSEAT